MKRRPAENVNHELRELYEDEDPDIVATVKTTHNKNGKRWRTREIRRNHESKVGQEKG